MAFVGMDVGQVRQLSQKLKQKHDEITHMISEISSALGSAQWVGPDKNRFEGDWNGHLKGQLNQVAQALQAASDTARKNADEQQQASDR